MCMIVKKINRRGFIGATAAVLAVASIHENGWWETSPTGCWIHFYPDMNDAGEQSLVGAFKLRQHEHVLGFLTEGSIKQYDRRLRSLRVSINQTIQILDEKDGLTKYKWKDIRELPHSEVKQEAYINYFADYRKYIPLG